MTWGLKELITLYDLDIRDSKQLEEIFEKEEIGIIFHFASKNKQKERNSIKIEGKIKNK